MQDKNEGTNLTQPLQPELLKHGVLRESDLFQFSGIAWEFGIDSSTEVVWRVVMSRVLGSGRLVQNVYWFSDRQLMERHVNDLQLDGDTISSVVSFQSRSVDAVDRLDIF